MNVTHIIIKNILQTNGGKFPTKNNGVQRDKRELLTQYI